jgi:hypothetical protein
MASFFSRWVSSWVKWGRAWINRWRWSISKATQQVLSIDGVYDVMCEPSTPGRYLLHVWVVSLDEVSPKIREALRKRPRSVKIDVWLYRRETE